MAVAIGLVGSGRRAAQVHAPAIAGTAGATFAGVWGRTAERTRALAREHDVPACLHLDELLERCDALVLAVPPPVQAELAVDAAHRGRAVLLERPIAGDVAGAEMLARAVAAARVISLVALSWRFQAAVRRFVDVDAPATAPIGGHARLMSGAMTADPSPWRRERGVLRDEGADLVDLLDAAVGSIVGVRAHGETSGWVGLLLDHRVGRFSESSLYANAAPGTHEASVEVHGGKGSAAIDLTSTADPDAVARMYREFVDAVESGTPHPLDVQHGLHLQRVIEAAETDILVGA